MPQFACAHCRLSFQRPAYQVKNPERCYCTHDCYAAARRTAVEKSCEVCGNSYHVRFGRSGKSRFCSWKCQRESRKSKDQITCAHCGNTCFRKPSQIRKAKNTFCSTDCLAAFSTQKVEVRCNGCGKILMRPPCQAKGERLFCSMACRPLDKIRKVPVQCHYCKCNFERFPHHVRERNFCGPKCHGKWRSETFSGENSWAWKGGWQSYYGPDWNSQSRKARKRDGYQCQQCGQKQEKHYRALDVHHIKPFREFGYIPGENNNHVQANNLQNLITLCPACHGKADSGQRHFQPKLF